MTKLTDKLHFVTGLAPAADRFSGTVQTDWISLANYKSAAAIVEVGAGATGTTLLTVEQATLADGTGNEAIPFTYREVTATGTSDVPGARTQATSAGFTITAGGSKVYEIEVEARDLDPSKPFISVKGVEQVDSPVAGSILFVLAEPRNAALTPESAIA